MQFKVCQSFVKMEEIVVVFKTIDILSSFGWYNICGRSQDRVAHLFNAAGEEAPTFAIFEQTIKQIFLSEGEASYQKKNSN